MHDVWPTPLRRAGAAANKAIILGTAKSYGRLIRADTRRLFGRERVVDVEVSQRYTRLRRDRRRCRCCGRLPEQLVELEDESKRLVD